MDPIEIKNIVDILISEVIVVRNWTRVYNSLELGGNIVSLENQFKMGTITDYDLFFNILTQWVSEKSLEATISKLVGILSNLKFQSAADKLETISNHRSSASQPIFFEVGSVVSNFTGREDEIVKLVTKFDTSSHSLVRIIGMGGVGKSELVKTFAHIYFNTVHCIWLNGGSEQSINDSVFRLADLIGVRRMENNKPRPTEDIFNEGITTLKKCPEFGNGILLIIDNVDEANQNVQLILIIKIARYHCFVVVTSRNVGVLGYAGDVVNLDVLEDEDSRALVKGAFQDENEDHIHSLCVLLHNFPLALQQAIAYIKMEKLGGVLGTDYKIRNYISDYESQGQKPKLLGFPLNKIEHEYKYTTLATWNVSIDGMLKFDAKLGQLAIELLDTIAYFAPDGIPLELLGRFRFSELTSEGVDSEKDNIEKAIKLLKEYSLVKVEKSVISIHRLVQEVIRIKLQSCPLDHCTLCQDHINHGEVEVLGNLIVAIFCIQDTLKQADMAHILSVWKYVSKYDHLIKDFADLPSVISNRLLYLSLYKEMLEFANDSYDKLKTLLGENYMELLILESILATALNVNGKYEDALEKFKKVYDKQKSVFGEYHTETLETGHNMAGTYKYLGRLDEALNLYQEVLSVRVKIFGEYNKWSMKTRHEIATVLMSQGKHSEAIRMFKGILEWEYNHFGKDHPSTLVTMHNIAECHYGLEEYQEAVYRFRDVASLKRMVHGHKHSSTLDSMFMLAGTLDKLNKTVEAFEICKDVLSAREELLGPQHPDTVLARKQLELIQQTSERNPSASNPIPPL